MNPVKSRKQIITMKRIAFILAAVLAIAGCGNSNNKSNSIENNAENVEAGEASLVGAFGEQRDITEEEMEMFRSVTEGDSLNVYTPLSVSTQVVAGINYKFYCRLSDESAEDNPSHCWLTIYKPLPGQGDPKVTSIEKVL